MTLILYVDLVGYKIAITWNHSIFVPVDFFYHS